MEAAKQQHPNHERLADHILEALNMAVEQKDIPIADALVSALELSMTRNAGGREFTERRDYPSEIATVLNRLDSLR